MCSASLPKGSQLTKFYFSVSTTAVNQPAYPQSQPLPSSAPPMGGPVLPPSPYGLMPYPGSIPGVPEGLEYLAFVDQLIVKQEVELLEVIIGIESKNKYRIYNSYQQVVYQAFEESGLFQRLFCSGNRGFTIHIVDNMSQKILSIIRNFRCCSGCCWCADYCCKHPLTVTDKFGNKLGMIRMMNSCYRYRFGIFNENDELLYEVWAPLIFWQCICMRGGVEFTVCNASNNLQVATIKKLWAGFLKEYFSDADTISVSFPMDLNVVHKALMLATIFLIDFTMYEKNE